MKTNLVEVDSALDKVCKLTAYHYDKRENLESNDYNMKEVGIIAQDLQEVLPEAVVESEGMLTISDSAVNALLINAIKELRAEIAEPKGAK